MASYTPSREYKCRAVGSGVGTRWYDEQIQTEKCFHPILFQLLFSLYVVCPHIHKCRAMVAYTPSGRPKKNKNKITSHSYTRGTLLFSHLETRTHGLCASVRGVAITTATTTTNALAWHTHIQRHGSYASVHTHTLTLWLVRTATVRHFIPDSSKRAHYMQHLRTPHQSPWLCVCVCCTYSTCNTQIREARSTSRWFFVVLNIHINSPFWSSGESPVDLVTKIFFCWNHKKNIVLSKYTLAVQFFY